ncbi:Uncharacterized protein DAT39_023562, partial [Clarias magur]
AFPISTISHTPQTTYSISTHATNPSLHRGNVVPTTADALNDGISQTSTSPSQESIIGVSVVLVMLLIVLLITISIVRKMKIRDAFPISTISHTPQTTYSISTHATNPSQHRGNVVPTTADALNDVISQTSTSPSQ